MLQALHLRVRFPIGISFSAKQNWYSLLSCLTFNTNKGIWEASSMVARSEDQWFSSFACVSGSLGERSIKILHFLFLGSLTKSITFAGIDHFTTITDYVSLALYCFSQYKITAALKLLYRARYLFLSNYGHDHPEVALLDVSMRLSLHWA